MRKELSLSMFSPRGVFPTDRRRLTLLVQSLPPVPQARRVGRGPTWSAAPSWSPPAPQGTSCRPGCRRWWCRSPGTPPSAGPPGWRPARAVATARSPRSGCPGTPGLLLWRKTTEALRAVPLAIQEWAPAPGTTPVQARKLLPPFQPQLSNRSWESISWEILLQGCCHGWRTYTGHKPSLEESYRQFIFSSVKKKKKKVSLTETIQFSDSQIWSNAIGVVSCVYFY